MRSAIQVEALAIAIRHIFKHFYVSIKLFLSTRLEFRFTVNWLFADFFDFLHFGCVFKLKVGWTINKKSEYHHRVYWIKRPEKDMTSQLSHSNFILSLSHAQKSQNHCHFYSDCLFFLFDFVSDIFLFSIRSLLPAAFNFLLTLNSIKFLSGKNFDVASFRCIQVNFNE